MGSSHYPKRGLLVRVWTKVSIVTSAEAQAISLPNSVLPFLSISHAPSPTCASLRSLFLLARFVLPFTSTLLSSRLQHFACSCCCARPGFCASRALGAALLLLLRPYFCALKTARALVATRRYLCALVAAALFVMPRSCCCCAFGPAFFLLRSSCCSLAAALLVLRYWLCTGTVLLVLRYSAALLLLLS